jgi:hypothetical protein
MATRPLIVAEVYPEQATELGEEMTEAKRKQRRTSNASSVRRKGTMPENVAAEDRLNKRIERPSKECLSECIMHPISVENALLLPTAPVPGKKVVG